MMDVDNIRMSESFITDQLFKQAKRNGVDVQI